MIKKRNILVGVTVIAVVLSTGAVAFAATDTTGTQPDKEKPVFMEGRSAVMSDLTATQREAVKQARINSAKSALTELVDKGAITQDEADKLSEIETAPKERIFKADNGFSALTQEQRTALQEEEKAVLEDKLAGLVGDGTLTQEQADQLKQGHNRLVQGPDQLEQGSNQMKQGSNQMKQGSNQMKQGPNQMKQGHKMMVVNLTDDQRKAVMEATASAMKEAVANLVENGTLTQEEADAMAVVPVVKTVEKGDFNTLTEEQKTALNETMKEKWESALSDLVDNGTLTQDQADQLLNDKIGFHTGPMEGPGFKGHSGFEGHPGFNGRPDSDDQAADEQGTSL